MNLELSPSMLCYYSCSMYTLILKCKPPFPLQVVILLKVAIRVYIVFLCFIGYLYLHASCKCMHVVAIVLKKFMLLSSVQNSYHLKDIRALEDVQQHATRLIPSFKHIPITWHHSTYLHFCITEGAWTRSLPLKYYKALMASLKMSFYY